MEPFLGQIQPFGFNFAPRGWALCEGQVLQISSNTALFSLLGTTFGGDGRTSFGLPDLRGRSIVGVGNGPGISDIRWGQRGGGENHTLTTLQIPQHSHPTSVAVSTSAGEESTVSGNIIANHTNAVNEDATAGQTLGGVTSANTGGGQSFNIRNPYLGIYVSIALVGIYPSRN